jgi:hypothetical protein
MRSLRSIPRMTTKETGSATVTSMPMPSLRTDGACLTGTLENLGSGAKPMAPAALAKIKSDALDMLGRVVSVYERQIATGEVGANGSGTASASIPAVPSTGLLYGRIQSGKTVAMIALVAAAIDNGFRVIVVLTSDNVKLVEQTTERFGDLEGPLSIDALKPNDWSTDHKHIGKHLARSGAVFVCSKNTKRLDELLAFLDRIGAPDYPALILDDEADQATLDANLARNSRAKTKNRDQVDPTAIHRRVAESLRGTLRHQVFLQVTATPYALLLQTVGSELRPSFVRLLEPGEGYTGGEAFFEAHHVEGPNPPLAYVPDDESDEIANAPTQPPTGLQNAMAFFLVAAAAQGIADPNAARAGQNFLCHTSQLRNQHRILERMIREHLDRLGEDLENGRPAALHALEQARAELAKTLEEVPAVDAIVEYLNARLGGRKIVVVNAEADAQPGKSLNFIVGGNILGRGVTIENLLVTYYLREPKTGQMDTMLQHARMYGYRAKIMPWTRVYLPEVLAYRFHEIHEIERRLRRQLVHADMGRPIAVEKAPNLNPTRRAVLDPSYIDAFDAEDQIYPLHPDFTLTPTEYERMEARIKKLLGGDLANEGPEQIPFDELLALVDEFPYDTTQGSTKWIPGVIRRVLEKQRERCDGRAYLYSRSMRRTRLRLATGALEGKVLQELRDLDGPTFCAFRDDGRGLSPSGMRYWYPTVVLDKGTPSLIINTTPDA